MASARLAGAIVAVVLIGGGSAIWMSPAMRASLASLIPAQGPPPKKPAEHGPEGVIKLTADQIAKARIELAAVGGCTITQQITVPGTVTLDADRVGRVAAKVVGTVAELRKRLGDSAVKGEVVAVLESREVADAKSEYLAARLANELQQDLTSRDKSLWEGRAVPEQQYLKSRNAAAQSGDAAQYRSPEIAHARAWKRMRSRPCRSLPSGLLRNQNVRAPIDGQIVERRVDLGAPVGREGQESEIYVIADLSSLWVDLSVPTSDLANIAVGQPVVIATGQAGPRARSEGHLRQPAPECRHAQCEGHRHVGQRRHGVAAGNLRDGSDHDCGAAR